MTKEQDMEEAQRFDAWYQSQDVMGDYDNMFHAWLGSGVDKIAHILALEKWMHEFEYDLRTVHTLAKAFGIKDETKKTVNQICMEIIQMRRQEIESREPLKIKNIGGDTYEISN